MSRLNNLYLFLNDEKGRTLPEAKLFFYENESFDFKATYADKALTAVNPNPVIADGAGRFPNIFLDSGTYRVVLQDKDGVEISTKDDVDNLVSDGDLLGTSWISKYTTDQLSTATSLRAGNLVRTPGYYAGWAATASGIPVGGNDGVVEERDGSPEKLGSLIYITGTDLQVRMIFPNGVWVEQFGAVGDWNGTTGTDNWAAFTAAKDFAEKEFRAGAGSFKIEQELQLDRESLIFRGSGVGTFIDGINGVATHLVGTSLTGSVVRTMLESCVVDEMTIDASTARKMATPNYTQENYNGGVRVEAADVAAPEGDVFNTTLRRLLVLNQPNHGVLIVGRCYDSVIDRVVSKNCNGHGICIDNGERTGRTNTAVPGVINIKNCNPNLNQGHGICVGAMNDTNYAVRVVIENSEGLQNCGDIGLLEDESESFYHVDGLTILNGAATGTDFSGTDGAVAGIAVMGKGGTLQNVRILETTEPVRVLKHPGRDCYGWSINGPLIRNTASSYICNVATGVQNIIGWAGDETGSLTAFTNRDDISGLDVCLFDSRVIRQQITFASTIKDGNGLSISTEKFNNASITTTPITVFDASEAGKMWQLFCRHNGDPCLSSVTCTIVGGSTPVVSDVVNQSGAGVTYSVTVSGTDIQIATSSGARTSDVFVKEVVVQ